MKDEIIRELKDLKKYVMLQTQLLKTISLYLQNLNRKLSTNIKEEK